MSDYWKSVHKFKPLEAACLIAGIEPNANAAESLAVAHVLRKMQASYIEACGDVRNDLESAVGFPYEHEIFVEDRYVPLASVEMWLHVYQCSDTRNSGTYEHYRDCALNWLDQNLENFFGQLFLDEDLARWIEEMKIRSFFDFGDLTTQTPEERREHVRSVVEKCGGNKAEAARILAISRQRVDQLLKDDEKNKGKALRLNPQGPFSGLGS